MRWFWIDRFLEFQSGRRAVAVKNVTVAEEHTLFFSRGWSTMPSSLIIEGLAQTGGLLVGEVNDFRERVVLAKLGKAIFHGQAHGGDCLRYTAEIQDVQPTGAIVKATCENQGQVIMEADIIFAHLDDRFAGVELFEPAEFLRMLRNFRLFEVARDQDGQPLQIPAHLLEAERQVLQTQ